MAAWGTGWGWESDVGEWPFNLPSKTNWNEQQEKHCYLYKLQAPENQYEALAGSESTVVRNWATSIANLKDENWHSQQHKPNRDNLAKMKHKASSTEQTNPLLWSEL